ncbi:MAG: putative membrane protein [Myxococcota bacterium]|jgi:uncharacterized membrane protein
MRRHFGTFLQGLAVVVPVVFTIYVFYASVAWLDHAMFRLLGDSVRQIPGLGAVLALALVYIVGLLTRVYLFQRFVRFAENLIGRVPLLKTLYGSVRDLFQFFGKGDSKPNGYAVKVQVNEDSHIIGIVTKDDPEEALVGVYLPLSYQIGGYLVYMPRERISRLPIDVETALKLVLTGGMGATTTGSVMAPLPMKRQT